MAAEPQLTPACELAFAVARQGVQSSPPVEAPAVLRNFLDAHRPSRRALRAAHRALDADAAFRRRVADQAAADDYVGRAGWLFLHRPDGWEAEFAELTGRSRSGQRVAGDLGGDVHPAADVAEPDSGPGPERGVVTTAGPAADAALIVPDTGADGVVDAATGAGAGVEHLEPTACPVAGAETGSAAGQETSGLEREVHALRTLVESLMADGSLLAGATIRQLEEQVAALAQERDGLIAERSAMVADLGRSEAGAAATSERLAAVDAHLADAVAARVSLEERLAAVVGEQAAAATAQAAAVEQLTGHLVRVEAERDALAEELERSVAHLEQARELFHRSIDRASDELQATLAPSLRAAGDAARTLGEAAHQARAGAERLGGELAASVTAVDRCASGTDTTATATTAAGPEGWPDATAEPGLLFGEGAPGVSAAADPFTQDLSEFSKDLSDALAAYLSESGAHQPAPAVGAELAVPTWLGDHPAVGEGVAGYEPERRDPWANPTDRPATERRPVTVPDELTGDALATARFLASLPDVVLVVDGDAVGRLGWPVLSVAERRDALVSYLGDLTGTTGTAADVVFSSEAGDETTLPVSDLVRVRLTAPGVASGEAVVALITSYPVEWPVVVVTDDDLAAPAHEVGATLLSPAGLLDLFIAP